MCKAKHSSHFFLCAFFGVLINLTGLLPAALLLALHAWRGISEWWAAGALAAWVLYVILWLCFIGWAGRCSSAECVPKENKNPYSAGKYGA